MNRVKVRVFISGETLNIRAFIRSAAAAVAAIVLSAGAAAAQPADKVEADARDLLQQYASALASLDANAVKKLQPAIDLEAMKKAFKEMRALEVTIDNVKVLSIDASLARVSCRVSQTLTPKAGSKQTTAVTRVLRLRRAQTAWVIDAFER
jgi:hypothetical protein